jgi:hypothetical protein
MGIDARVENERGQLVAEVPDPRGLVNWLLALVEPQQSTCLRFIDPYGHAVFNRIQIVELRKELEALRFRVTNQAVRAAKLKYLDSARNWPPKASAEAVRYTESLSTSELAEHLSKVVTLVEDAISKGPHYYVRFVGD